MQQSAQPEQDLEQLWRRIVFYICISNIDDRYRADEIIRKVVSVIKNWRKVATSLGISAGEQNQMERAFRIVDAGKYNEL